MKDDAQNKESVGQGFGAPSGTNPNASFFSENSAKKSTAPPATPTQKTAPSRKKEAVNRIVINKEKTLENPPFITKLSSRAFNSLKYLYVCFDLPPAIKNCIMISSRDGTERSFQFEVPAWLYEKPSVILGDRSIADSNLLVSVLEEWKAMSKEHRSDKYYYTITFILPFPTIVTSHMAKCPSEDFECNLAGNNEPILGKDPTSAQSDVYFRRVSFVFKSTLSIYNDSKNKPVKERVAIFSMDSLSDSDDE